MPFTVEEFGDLVRILEEKPEWRVALRRLVLTDELLSLPEQVASLRADTDRRFQELIEVQKRTEEQMALLTGQVAVLAEAQRRTEEQVAELVQAVHALTIDVGYLKGEVLENRYRTRGHAYFGRMVRRAHVLSSDELTSLFEEAIESGTLSEAEVDEIALADAVVRGKRREDGTDVYLVVEVSWGVGPSDVERAVQRAALLEKTGTPTVPVVAGRWVTSEAGRLAHAKQVWQITDGQAVSPEPVAVLA